MTHSPNGIFVVKSGQSPAQLILLTQVQTNNPVKRDERGKSGFGSFDAYWLQRPELALFTNGKSFSGPLDAGADVFVTTPINGLRCGQNADYYTAVRDWPDSES